MDQGFGKGAVGHGVFVNPTLLKIRHHICQPRLRSRLRPLLLDFVHLFEILFSCWVEFGVEAFLGLEGACFTLTHIIDLKPTSHSRMHHNFPWRLHLLNSVGNLDIVQIRSRIQISLFVTHYLFEKVVSAGFTLFFL